MTRCASVGTTCITPVSRMLIERLLSNERILYPDEISGGEGEITGEGAAANGVPMGWLPCTDSLIHASLVAWAIVKAIKLGLKGAYTLRKAAFTYHVQIDDLTLDLLWPGEDAIIDSINSEVDIMSIQRRSKIRHPLADLMHCSDHSMGSTMRTKLKWTKQQSFCLTA